MIAFSAERNPMELNETLQQLRKQKGLTQEEVAQALYVSRTAVSKWESGRGTPSIDSLKALARFYSITIDELLTGAQALRIAEDEIHQKAKRHLELVFGLLDISCALFFFLPFFAQRSAGAVTAVALPALLDAPAYLKAIFWLVVLGLFLSGILMLAMQQLPKSRFRRILSLTMSLVGVAVFILCAQPYAAVFVLTHLTIKAFLLVKRP